MGGWYVFFVLKSELKEVSEPSLLEDSHKTGTQSFGFSSGDFVDFSSFVDITAVHLFELKISCNPQ